jgi:hypothetical protein
MMDAALEPPAKPKPRPSMTIDEEIGAYAAHAGR